MGGRIDDFAVVESRPSTFYVATAVRRALEDGEQRRDPRARLRRPGGLVDRRRHGRTVRPVDRLRRHRRAEQPPVVVLGQRRLQIARRRQDLEPRGPRRHAPHRPHGRAPDKSGRGLRRRPRATSGGRTRSGGSSAPPTAARPGSTRSSSTRTPASWTSPWIRRARRRCTPRPTSGAARLRLQRRRPRAARSGRRSTAARPGRSSREGLPSRGRRRAHRHCRVPPRPAHRLRPRRAREGRRHLPLRGQGRHLEEDVGHQPPAVLLQQGPRGSGQRPARVGPGCAPLPLRGRGEDLPPGRGPEDPRRLPRPVDRSRRLQPYPRRNGRRRAHHLRPRAELGLRQHRAPRPVLRDLVRPAEAVSRVRRTAGQRELVRPQPHPLPAGHLERGLVAGRRRRRVLHRDRSQRPRRHLHGEPGRKRVTLRRPHQRAAQHPAGAARRRTVPVQLELADRALAPRLRHGLLRRQPRLRLPRPRRELGRRQPGPHRQRRARQDDDLRQGGQGHAVAQRRRGALRHHHDHGRVAGQGRRRLDRNRRRQRPGHARRRRDLDAPEAARGRPRRHLREPRRAEPLRRGRRLPRLRRASDRRLRALSLPDGRLRPELARAGR